jgi:hypothetical protein
MGTTSFRIHGAVLSALAIAAGAAVCCCAGGCFTPGAGREPARLSSHDPGSKIPAIKRAAVADGGAPPRDTETAQHLVKSLESTDPAVRFYAIRGLQSLTGETFGYVWYVDDRDRREALDKWKQWLGGASPPGTVAEGDGRPE